MPLCSPFIPRTFVQCILALTLLALPAVASTARPQGRGPEDVKTLANYRLTMPTLRKVLAASREMEADPEVKKLENTREGPEKNITDMSIAELTALYDGMPPVKRAITRNGLSTREWATAFVSYMQAAIAVAEQDAARALGKPPVTPPWYVPKENINLIRQNQAEIEQLSEDS